MPSPRFALLIGLCLGSLAAGCDTSLAGEPRGGVTENTLRESQGSGAGTEPGAASSIAAEAPLALLPVHAPWRESNREGGEINVTPLVRLLPTNAQDRQGVLETTLYAPQGTGPFPVLIFSPGLGGDRNGYAYLGKHWARFGYVSIHVTHPGSDSALLDPRKPKETLHRMRAATMDPQVLVSRPLQIASVIDRLDQIERAVPGLVEALDRQRIGVAGHSFGAYTTLVVAGAHPRFRFATGRQLSDPRPRAFLALSPLGTGGAFDAESFAALTRPLLCMTGSLDKQPEFLDIGGAERGGAWRRESYDLAAPDEKWLLWLDGATHSTFSGGAGRKLLDDAAPRSEHLVDIQLASLAFWDAMLKDDAHALEWLNSKAPEGLHPAAGARWEAR
jgi:predicted dienelactone hydrolase